MKLTELLAETVAKLGPLLEEQARLLDALRQMHGLMEEIGALAERLDAGRESAALGETLLPDEEEEAARIFRATTAAQEWLAGLLNEMAERLSGELAGANETRTRQLDRFADTAAETRRELTTLAADLDALVERIIAREEEAARREESTDAAIRAEDTLPFDTPAEDADASPEARRRHRRHHLALSIRLEEPHRVLKGTAENVSVGGLFIATCEPVELGTLLHVCCELKDGTAIEADGAVAWTREAQGDLPAGIGVEFLLIADADRQRLEALVTAPDKL